MISLSRNDSAQTILNDVLKIYGLVGSLLFNGFSVFGGLLVSVILWIVISPTGRWHGNVLLEQPSQYRAPSTGCADLVFLSLLLWQNPQLFLSYIWLMFSTCCFLLIRVFSQKKTSVTGQQLALWLLTDLLFSLFWGAYITPFWWVPLFQNSAVVPKVAQCVVPMQIRYISYISSTISGLDHWTWPPRTNHSHSFFTPVRNARNQNTSKKLAHCSTQNTINSKQPSQNSQ